MARTQCRSPALLPPFAWEAAGHPAKKMYYTRLQIVHRAGDLDRTIRLHFGEHRTALADFGHRNFHILARNGVNKCVSL
jgi:hypothetical protein